MVFNRDDKPCQLFLLALFLDSLKFLSGLGLCCRESSLRFVGILRVPQSQLYVGVVVQAQSVLGNITRSDPSPVWDVIGQALVRENSTGSRLRIKLQHWFGELIPAELLPRSSY